MKICITGLSMAINNVLCKVDSLLSTVYKEPKGKMEEKKIKMSLSISDHGRQYLLYSFDKVVRFANNTKAADLQPYFKTNAGVKSMCDYFLFCWERGKLYVLLIELKQGANNVTHQLLAGKLFALYIISTLNRVENTTIQPEIRRIAVRNSYIIKKGTSMKSVVYDSDSFCTFAGSEFHLPEFLK